jgi:citrate synthase
MKTRGMPQGVPRAFFAIEASVTSGIGALKGPLHGGANRT